MLTIECNFKLICLFIIFLLPFRRTAAVGSYCDLYAKDLQSFDRNAVKLERYKWPNGTVPFTFHPDFSVPEQLIVVQAMTVFATQTCVRFIPKTDEHVEHIQFVKGDGCGSSIGYRHGQRTPLNVTYSDYCLTIRGVIQHEMLHVLGLLHEQSRPDRDNYITIIWDNIPLKWRGNFRKASSAVVETFGLPYDFESLMHYPKHAFAKPGTNTTMFATEHPTKELGQSAGPTIYDLEKIRRMYKCKLQTK